MTEVVFDWPGLGRWLITSIALQDYAAIKGGTLAIATFTIVASATIEVLSTLIYPARRRAIYVSQGNIYPEVHISSPQEQTWRVFRRNTLAMIGLWGLGLLCLLTLLAPWLAPYAANTQFSDALLMPPSWAADGNIDFFLGTDDLGRDLLSRLILVLVLPLVMAY